MIDAAARKIRDMQTHSSSAVAIAAAEALRELCDRNYPAVDEFLRDLEYNSTRLRQANPSHASLQTTQRDLLTHVESADPADVPAAKAALTEGIDQVVERVEAAKSTAAGNALELLDDGDVLLTHDFSSTVLSTARQANDAGLSLEVFTMESRPRYLGRRMARRLADLDDVAVTLIVDNAAAHFMESCDRVLIGMSCIVGERLFNRVGTFGLSTAAAHLDVPVTVVGAGTKIAEDGFAFENDFRSSVEVMREPTDDFEISNPAYDATPLSLIDSIVTDRGIQHP